MLKSNNLQMREKVPVIGMGLPADGAIYCTALTV